MRKRGVRLPLPEQPPNPPENPILFLVLLGLMLGALWACMNWNAVNHALSAMFVKP